MNISQQNPLGAGTASPVRLQPWLIRAPRPEIQLGLIGVFLVLSAIVFLAVASLMIFRRAGNIGSQFFSLAGVCSGFVGLAFHSRRLPANELTGLGEFPPDNFIEGQMRLIFQRDARVAHPSHLKSWEGLASKMCIRQMCSRPVILHWQKIDHEFRAIETAFEPRSLDETNSSFQELCAMLFEQAGSETSGFTFISHFMRRIMFTGNWLLLVPVGFLIIGSIICAVEGQAFLPLLGLIVVPLMFLVHGRRMRGMAQELYVAPGSLLRRSRIDRGHQSNLHIFDRSRSALVAAQKQKGVWIMAVADPNETASGILTDKELRVLVGAWLSPIDPPAAERLRDFE